MQADYQDGLVFDALGNPVRRGIIRLLAERPRTVGSIAAEFPISRPAISKHLQVLEGAALVRHRRVGTRNEFRLDQEGFAGARDWLDQFWDDALARLALVAGNTPEGS